MNSRRIALVSDAVMPFNKGGKEMRIYQLTRELARRGFQIDVYTMQWWREGDTYEAYGVTFHALCKLHPLYAGKRRSISEALLFSLSCLKLMRYDFDVLEVDHMPVFPIFTTKIVSLLKRRPMYATWHEVWGKSYWQEYLGTFKGTIAYILERTSVSLPNQIIAVSELTRRQLTEDLHYKGPITLVRNAIDMHDIQKVKPLHDDIDILFAGRLIAHKNVDLLLKAIAKLSVERPQLRCIIIGDGPEKKHLDVLIKKLGIEKNVVMLGRVESNDDVIARMKAAKVFATPSGREGFGITVLEALTTGCRIVTVDVSSNAAQYLVTSETGTVCKPTVASLAKALRNELAKADVAKRKNAVTKDYDWSTSAHVLEGVYA